MGNLNLRWMFFAESLPRGQGIIEILTILILSSAACLLLSVAITVLPRLGYSPEDAISWSIGGLLLGWAAVFILFRFGGLQSALIAIGLTLVASAFVRPQFQPWQLDVAFGFWLALRAFSAGPRYGNRKKR